MEKILTKHDSSSNWAKAKNFIPKKDELIYYDDLKKFKIGDGRCVLSELPFENSEQSYVVEELLVINSDDIEVK